MELIKEFERICSQIGEHVGYEGWVESYQINTADKDSFWQSFDNDTNISWAETKEDILEDTGEVYNAEPRGIFRGEDITLALINSDFSSELYWLVLDSKKEIKE